MLKHMRRIGLSLAGGSALLLSAAAANATIYTQDTNIAHFTAGISNYATFSNFGAGDVGSPFTPSSAELAANGFRVYSGGSLPGLSASNNWILASFATPQAAIRVFPNIDHFGSQYDGFQYTIEGSNNGTSWTPLFDALSVVGASEPFTLGAFTGTAPSSVNNVITGGCTAGCVGYEANFGFGAAYKFYAFGASTVAFAQGNADQELSAVAAGVPELGTWAMMLIGFGLVGLRMRRPEAERFSATA